MDLELRQLEAFAVTARTGGFTAAARELGTGQPAVSQAVRRLEDRLGVVLFERSGRRVELTGAARTLLPHVEAALDALGAVERVALQVASGRAGTIRLVSTSGSLGVLRELLDRFATEHPDVRVDLVPRPAPGRREGLRRSEIDLALVRSDTPARGVAYTLVRSEPWCILLGADHPLVTLAVPPDLDALARWPFAPLGVHRDSPALDTYRTAAAARQLVPRIGPAAAAAEDLYARLIGNREWTLLAASNSTTPADGLTTLPAPTALLAARLWLAHRLRPSLLEATLLTWASDSQSALPLPKVSKLPRAT